MQRTVLSASILILLLSIGVASAQNGPYSFVLKKAYRYATEMKIESIQEFMGQPVNMSLDSRVVLHIVADTILADGTFRMWQTTDSSTTRIETPMGSQTLGAEMVGKSFAYTMRPDGKIIARDTAEELGLGAGLMQMVASMGSFPPSLAGAVLESGKSWVVAESDTSGTRSTPMIVTTRTAYTVKGSKRVQGRECLEIAFSGITSVNGVMEQRGMSMEIAIEGTTKGVLAFDVAAGLLVEMTSDITQDTRFGDATGEAFSGTSTANGTSTTVYLPD